MTQLLGSPAVDSLVCSRLPTLCESFQMGLALDTTLRTEDDSVLEGSQEQNLVSSSTNNLFLSGGGVPPYKLNRVNGGQREPRAYSNSNKKHRSKYLPDIQGQRKTRTL